VLIVIVCIEHSWFTSEKVTGKKQGKAISSILGLISGIGRLSCTLVPFIKESHGVNRNGNGQLEEERTTMLILRVGFVCHMGNEGGE